MNFFVQWTMLTVDQHYLDFPATLPLYSSPRTYYVWEFHLTYPGLFKISPFIKDLGVSYKVTPIISVWRISQCNHFEFPPLLQSLFIYLFFCPCALIWHKKFLTFSEMRSKLAKTISLPPKSFGPFPRQKIPAKNGVDTSQK